MSAKPLPGPEPAQTGESGQRLDKWLWFVRVIKTRTQAAALVTEGKVRVNRQRIDKPSQTLKPGDVVTVNVRGHIRILKMIAPGERRGPAAEAQQLFEDLTPPPTPSQAAQEAGTGHGQRLPGLGRPTKRDRRRIDQMQSGDD